MNVGVAGLGLIGGSFAKTMKENGITVYGYDINESSYLAAKMTHAVDERLTADTFRPVVPAPCSEHHTDPYGKRHKKDRSPRDHTDRNIFLLHISIYSSGKSKEAAAAASRSRGMKLRHITVRSSSLFSDTAVRLLCWTYL